MKFSLKITLTFALILDSYFILKALGEDDEQEVVVQKEAFNLAYTLQKTEPHYSSIYDLQAEFEKTHELFTRNNWPDPENYIELSYRWYNLIVKLYDKWSSSEIQDNRRTHETSILAETCRTVGAANLETGHILYLQQLNPDILDDPDYKYILNHEITPMKSKALCDLFEVTLKWPRYNVTNPTPDSLRIDGDFVVSGDIALLYETGHKHINTVEIFALNKFIVDYDLSFNSETPFTMFVTSPMWDVFTADEIRVKPQQGANWQPSFHIGSSSSGSSFFGIGMKFRQMADRLELAIEPQPSTSEYISLYQLVPPDELQVPRSAYGSALTNPNPSADINYDYHAIMNEYEKYLLEYRNHLFRNTLLTEYFTKIYTYPSFKTSLFNTRGFVNEIHILEDNFLSLLRDNIPLRSVYETLDQRFDDYSNNPKAEEATMKYIEVRKHINEALDSKMKVLTSDDGLVVDLAKYLSNIMKSTEDMMDIAQREKAKKVMMYNKNMKDNVLHEIIRVKEFVDEQVMPQLGLTNDQLDQQIENLLNKIMRLTGETKKAIRLREQEKKNLAEVQATKRTFAVLSAIGGALLAFGTMGGGAFIWIGGTATAVNALVDSVDDPEITQKLKMSEGMMNVKHFIDAKAHTLEKLLEILDDKNPEVFASLKSGIQKTLAELQEGVDNAPFEEVQKLLSSTEERLKSMSSSPAGGLDLVQELKRAIEVAQISSADVYLKYYRNDTALQVLSELASKNDPEEIQALNRYERNIHALLIPAIKYLRNVTMSATNMTDTKSLARIDIARWRANDVLEDIYFRVKEFTEGWYEGKMILMVLDKLKRALDLVFSLLSRITSYVQYGQLIDYISNINAVEYEASLAGDHEMMDIIAKLKYIKKYNNAIAKYKMALNSYRLYAFPFAPMLDAVNNFDLLTDNNNMPTIEDLAYHAELQLGYLNMKMTDYKQDIIRAEDADVFEVDFDGSSPRKPVFFTWNLRQTPEILEKLFTGQSVKLFADVKQSVNRNAVKFNKIEFRFKSNKAKGQEQINNALSAYNVNITHSGESYFRCGESFYKTKSTSLRFGYSFEKDASGQPVITGSSYRKLMGGDYLLSPYTEWTINIVSETNNFAALDSLKTKRMDLELIGYGQYVQGENLCSKHLLKYYEVVN